MISILSKTAQRNYFLSTASQAYMNKKVRNQPPLALEDSQRPKHSQTLRVRPMFRLLKDEVLTRYARKEFKREREREREGERERPSNRA